MKKSLLLAAILVLNLIFGKNVYAGAPLVNLEGVGGIAFNPLAYPADGGSLIDAGKLEILGKPRFGVWYANLGDSKIDWTSFGVADTLFKRLEISYAQEAVSWVGHPTFHKNNVGAKLLLLNENSFDTKFLPAISVGTIYKTTSDKSIHELGFPLRTTGQDWYVVATKTITQLPLPVIVSGGILSSQEFVTGVLGFSNKRKTTGFANVDLVLPHGIVAGYEFKQGEHFANVKNTNYWDLHLAWLANDKLTLVAAYTNTGSYGKVKNTRTGLGDGFVLSAHYAF